jgi:NADPH:quinone reductase-like Zn-dependent oxidoreductase
MNAVVFDRHGGPDVLQYRSVPDPVPGHGEVKIKVAGCAVNHLDLWVREGIPGVAPMPHILGSEISGTVEELGPEATGVAVGDSVLVSPGRGCGRCEFCVAGREQICRDFQVLGNQRQGGYAEFVVVNAADCLPVNDRWSLVEWAAVPLVFQTAWHMLVDIGKIRAGQDVLIESAGSGVGTAGIQIARLFGARVIATAGGETKRQWLVDKMGAEVTIDYRAQDVRKTIQSLTSGRGVDIVFSHVGGPTFTQSMACLARGGTLVTCGATAGPIVELDLRFLFTRELNIRGAYLGTRSDLREVVQLVAAGKLRPVIDSVLPLSEAAKAQERVARREVLGKIVLTP